MTDADDWGANVPLDDIAGQVKRWQVDAADVWLAPGG